MGLYELYSSGRKLGPLEGARGRGNETSDSIEYLEILAACQEGINLYGTSLVSGLMKQ